MIRTSDPPTKSGPLLTRLYRRALKLNDKWMIWPWQIEAAIADGVSMFLVIDDFLGTGHQFRDFAAQFRIGTYLPHTCMVYAPLVAHVHGISELQLAFPGLHVCAAEVLDDTYNLFCETSLWFRDRSATNSPGGAKEFYDSLVRTRGLPISPAWQTGYGGLAIAYGFQHATPDNCLPIFWIRGPYWQSLLER